MSVCPSTSEELCDCCTGTVLETPELISNRPALSAVAYRVGRYATFNASMLASLSQTAYTPLGLLRTRDPSDFTIGLLDSWSVVLDILTFYQERFANEAFLRTALDQRSVFELSRLIGYVPSPGVSATDVLAFTLSAAPGSPDNVTIAAGTRVQSVPGPGQQPQVYETSATITARIAYNALAAQTTTPWTLDGSASTWIQGTSNNINVGDMLLFVAATQGVANTAGPAESRFVTKVTLDSVNAVTQIDYDAAVSPGFQGKTADAVCVYVFRKKAALYGVQAPNPQLLGDVAKSIPGAPAGSNEDWSYATFTPGATQLNLDAVYTGIVPTGTAPQWAVFAVAGYQFLLSVTQVGESNPNLYTLTAKTTELTFGATIGLNGGSAIEMDLLIWLFKALTRDMTVYIQATQLQPVGLPLSVPPGSPFLPSQSGLLAPVAGSRVPVMGGQQIAAGQAAGVSGKRLRLQVVVGASVTFVPAESTAALPVTNNQIFLIDAWPPTATTGSTVEWSVLTTSGVAGNLTIGTGNQVFLPSDKNDTVATEAVSVATVDVSGDITTLNLTSALTRAYDAATVLVNANAVNASHGETVQELLGSGDATNPALTFTLKQAPLTYISSTGGNGTQSTLQVWVNNLQWHEVPNLLESGPADRVFVTRVSSTGLTVVQFGDGNNGARTPTGQMNIRAVYRKGIGSAGMVAAGQLSQALDRPQGLKTVVNPSPAAGGSDPATAADARARAPLPTLTIGRVVSLEDYQNYALNFGGIAKAAASWTFFNGTRGVFLTIAGPDGATFSADDTVVVNLSTSLRRYGNQYVPLQVATFTPANFQIAANVRIDATDYDPTLVLAQVWQNLVNAFAFDTRLLGQSVVASDIVALIQQTPGVIATQLTFLGLSGSATTGVPATLCAPGPLPPQGATLLLLDPTCKSNIQVWS